MSAMDLLTEPVLKQPRRAADTHTAIEWLDALSAGTCDRDTFLRGVNDILQRAPDAGWELLALLDQYYRRGRISDETFTHLNAHLQRALMGKNRAADVNKQTATPDPSANTVASPTPRLGAHIHAISKAPTDHSADPIGARAPAGPLQAPERSIQTPARSLVPGDVLRNRYRIVGLLGRGGMGAVFEAVDEFRVDRSNGEHKVAIKVLHDAVIQRPRLFAELRREFQHLQSLSHPNIVRVHEFDRDGDTAFFTMEYLSGELLSRLLAAQEHPLYRPYALAIIRDVGAAVVHAHARGIVHGDLNPGNIFITDAGEVRVLDFGASYQLRRGPWISEFEATEQPSVATPSYASCELLEGEAADVRDDIYALGCIMYVLLAGEHPFGNQSALRARTLSLKPKRPSGLTQRTWNALRAALEFKRENRPTDMQSWLNRLELRTASPALPALAGIVATRRRTRQGSTSVAIGALIAVLLACLAWWASTHDDSLTQGGQIVERVKSAFAQLANRFSSDGGRGGGAGTQSGAGTESGAGAVPDAPAASRSAPHADQATQDAPPVSPTDPAVIASAQQPPASQPPPQEPTPVSEARVPRQAPGAEVTTAESTPPTVESTPPAFAPTKAQTTSKANATPGTDAASQTPYRARVELAADNVDVTLDDTVARVVVHRSRLMRGDATFSWWTESGTAKPGRDFIPVKAHEETMTSGKSSATLFIPILPDPRRRDARSFYVVIDAANDNAAVGPRTLTQVTIPGSD